MSKKEVVRRCGEPSRRQRSRGGGKGKSGEIWTYDLGSGQLDRHLTFRGDRLERIDLGGYGR
jgi:hypothetical protein